MSNIPYYEFSVEETFSFLEKENRFRSVIISDNPLFKEISNKPIDCLLFKGELMKQKSEEIVKILTLIGADGHIIIDNQVNYPQELCLRLKEIGFQICLLSLKIEVI